MNFLFKYLIYILFIFIIVKENEALRCYVCEDCTEVADDYIQTCGINLSTTTSFPSTTLIVDDTRTTTEENEITTDENEGITEVTTPENVATTTQNVLTTVESIIESTSQNPIETTSSSTENLVSTTEVTTKETIEDTKGTTQETTEIVTEGTTEGTTQETTEGITEETTERTTFEATEKVTEETTEEITIEETTDTVTEDTTEGIVEEISEETAQTVTEELTEFTEITEGTTKEATSEEERILISEMVNNSTENQLPYPANNRKFRSAIYSFRSKFSRDISEELEPRCIVAYYTENGETKIIRGCSFKSDDANARCREAIGDGFDGDMSKCKLCDTDLCNSVSAPVVQLVLILICTLIVMPF